MLEELGKLFDRLSVDVEDAATAFAQALRLMLRLCRSRPQISAVLVGEGMHYMESEGRVRPKNASSSARAGGEGRFRVPHCSADNSRITLSTYRLARGRRVHSSAVSSRQAARYSSEIRCRSATKLGSVPISEIS